MELGQNKVFIGVLFLLLIGVIIAVVLITTGNAGGTSSGDSIASLSVIGNFEVSLTEDAIDFEPYIETASNTWSNIIQDFNVIPITYRVDKTNGNVLAYAWMNNPNDIFAGGVITLGSGISNPTGGWANIIEHEIGHVLGIGASTKWTLAILSDNDGHRTLDRNHFPNAGDAYDDLINEGKVTGTVGDNIPLSDHNDSVEDGGDHWDELIFDDELMTPITDNIMPLSSLSIAALKDIGFTVNDFFDEDNNL